MCRSKNTKYGSGCRLVVGCFFEPTTARTLTTIVLYLLCCRLYTILYKYIQSHIVFFFFKRKKVSATGATPATLHISQYIFSNIKTIKNGTY